MIKAELKLLKENKYILDNLSSLVEIPQDLKRGNQQRIYQKRRRVKKWVPVCPLDEKFRLSRNDICLDPVF